MLAGNSRFFMLFYMHNVSYWGLRLLNFGFLKKHARSMSKLFSRIADKPRKIRGLLTFGMVEVMIYGRSRAVYSLLSAQAFIIYNHAHISCL